MKLNSIDPNKPKITFFTATQPASSRTCILYTNTTRFGLSLEKYMKWVYNNITKLRNNFTRALLSPCPTKQLPHHSYAANGNLLLAGTTLLS